jgi:hypothetical protein
MTCTGPGGILFAAGTKCDRGAMSKKQPVIEYRFSPELVVAMRVAFLKACEAPQVTDQGEGHGTRPLLDGQRAAGVGPGGTRQPLVFILARTASICCGVSVRSPSKRSMRSH